jgi:hypothetical protein
MSEVAMVIQIAAAQDSGNRQVFNGFMHDFLRQHQRAPPWQQDICRAVTRSKPTSTGVVHPHCSRLPPPYRERHLGIHCIS